MRAVRGLVSFIHPRTDQPRGEAPHGGRRRGFSILRRARDDHDDEGGGIGGGGGGRRGRRDRKDGPVVGETSDEEGSTGSWTADALARKSELAGPAAAEEEVGEECCVCLMELEAVRYRGKMDCCDHVVCWTCIQEWSLKAHSCPICQRTFTKFKRTKAKPARRTPKGRRQTMACELEAKKEHKKERTLWERMPWRRRQTTQTRSPRQPWNEAAEDAGEEEIIVAGPMSDSHDDREVARQLGDSERHGSSGNEDGEPNDTNSRRTSAPEDSDAREGSRSSSDRNRDEERHAEENGSSEPEGDAAAGEAPNAAQDATIEPTEATEGGEDERSSAMPLDEAVNPEPTQTADEEAEKEADQESPTSETSELTSSDRDDGDGKGKEKDDDDDIADGEAEEKEEEWEVDIVEYSHQEDDSSRASASETSLSTSASFQMPEEDST